MNAAVASTEALTVYGFEREEADMVKIIRRLAAGLAAHRDDRSEERLDD